MDAADLLRSLQVPGRPIVLPNAWDPPSARALADAHFPVIATSSAAITATLGREGPEALSAEEMLAFVGRIVAAVPGTPVTADLESGYGLPAEEIAERARAAGVAGLNLEDSDHASGGLRPVAEQAARLADLRAAAPDLVINARVDATDVGDGVERARAYRAAGADCVYPIWAAEPADVAAYVEAAEIVNIMIRAVGTRELASLGVARISFGAQTQRWALDAMVFRSRAYVFGGD